MRRASNDAGGAVIGAKVGRVLGTSAADNEREKAPADGVELSVSDAAQQLSARAWVTTLSEPAPGSVDPCIEQSPLLEQHAMRASGEACQPAHSAQPAAASVRATTKAVVRLSNGSTSLGCTGTHTGVNPMGDSFTKMRSRSRLQRSHISRPRAATKPAQLTNPRTRAITPPSRFAFRRYHMM